MLAAITSAIGDINSALRESGVKSNQAGNKSGAQFLFF